MAVPQCGLSIPKRVGDLPGHEECCIFHLYTKENPNDPQFTKNYYLEAVLDPMGNPMRSEVYNIYEMDVAPRNPPNERYVRITKEKGGRWLVENPAALPSDTGTSSTSTSSSTTPVVQSRPCVSSAEGCRYTWVASTKVWTPPNETVCQPTSSTSSTSSTSMASTTTLPCLCPVPPDKTTTSTSSTTTPPAPCVCLWPTYCGTQDDECTITSCAPLTNEPPDCGQTSSTSSSTSSSSTTSPGPCPPEQCPPTSAASTTTPDPCADGCDWTWTSYGMVRTGGGCAPQCPCAPPTIDPEPEECDTYHTACVPTATPPGTCDMSCDGDCIWYGGPFGGGWSLVSNRCAGACCCYGEYTGPFCCTCRPPPWTSAPCETARTFCGCNPDCCPSTSATSTTSYPWPPCCSSTSDTTTSTSTSTTSSTTQPCERQCHWKANVPGIGQPLEWQDVTAAADACPASCPCEAPVNPPENLCETARTSCGTRPTSTTTSTSTSSTTTPGCFYYCAVTSPELCAGGANASNSGCIYFCGGEAAFEAANPGLFVCNPWNTAGLCQSISVCATTTTTTTSTTSSSSTSSTTTPPQYQCFQCYGASAGLTGCYLDTPDEFNCSTNGSWGHYNTEAECTAAGCPPGATTTPAATTTTTSSTSSTSAATTTTPP